MKEHLIAHIDVNESYLKKITMWSCSIRNTKRQKNQYTEILQKVFQQMGKMERKLWRSETITSRI